MKDWCDLLLTGKEEPTRNGDGMVVALVGHIWSNKARDPPKPGDVVIPKDACGLGQSQVQVDSLVAIQACNRPDGGEPFAFLGVRGHIIVAGNERALRVMEDREPVFLTPNEVGPTVPPGFVACICRHRGPTHGPNGCTAIRCPCKAPNPVVMA